MSKPMPAVTVVILDYNSPADMLRDCLQSVADSKYDGEIRAVLADNGSTEARDADVVAGRPWIDAVRLGRNWGFAGGINRALAHCTSELVFLLNTDATVDPDAIQRCVEALSRQPDTCLGVAPKIVFRDSPAVIDAVGNAVTRRGEAFNVGAGQIDVGQYDREEGCFGPCFAAALLRRSAFDGAVVGPLADRYFMYYEDVDWNCRAQLRGYSFVTAPAAVVRHVHSATTRTLESDFKRRHIERNLALTLLRDFDAVGAARAMGIRAVALISRTRSPRDVRRLSRTLLDVVALAPWALWSRKAVRSGRLRGSNDFVRFADDETPCVDPETLRPILRPGTIAAIYRRRFRVDRNDRWRAVARAADEWTLTGDATATRALVATERPEMIQLVEAISREGGRTIAARAPKH